MFEYINKLRFLLHRKNKIFLLWLLVLTFILSLVETIGISAIMPFISVASNPDLIDGKYYKAVYEFFGFENKNNFVIAFGFLLIGFYFFRATYNILYGYLSNKFAFGSYHYFAYRLFESYLGMPYKEFVKKNSAILTKTIVTEAQHLSFLIQNLLLLISELFTVVLLYVILLFVNWKMTIVLSVVLGAKILLLTKTISRAIKKQGVKKTLLQNQFYKIINETLGNFKIVKLIGNEDKLFESFAKTSSGYAKSNVINSTFALAPRMLLETVGFSILIATVMYILFKYENASFVIPIISMYALALYRMLPAVNRIITSYNGVLFYASSLEIIHEDLSYKVEKEGLSNIAFASEIVLRDVSFSYDGKTNVVDLISLQIYKGDKVAFIGESGSGKSTLVDLIIGIYKPQNGEISIDGVLLSNENIKSWRKKVGYIPQTIYLFDGTVGENVAFGHEYDELKIIEALKKANIYDFLLLKEGIDTKVGDGGIQLSGGQKQRIGIARALYSDPEVLVLDEATSALDNETEAKIMDEIYEVSVHKTLIVIAHRLSTIERCNKKFKIINGKLQ